MNHYPLSAVLIASLLATTFAPGQAGAASMVGDTVELWGIAQVNGNETLRDTFQVVDPGVEYQAMIINPIYDYDVAATSITLTTLSPWFSPWFNSGLDPSALELRDIDFVGEPLREIVGVSLEWTGRIIPEDNAPANYPDFGQANVSWTADSVKLTTGPYRFPEGSVVTMNLVTALVPEPTSGLLLMGATVSGGLRRRR